MTTVRMSLTTVMSEPRFEVFDVITGAVLVITRDAGRALAIAAAVNSGS